MNQYNPTEIEKKWQEKWESAKVYSPDMDQAKKPFYNLMMFPYPSAEGMHVGNMYAFTGADVYGRFQRMQGNDVFEPIGLDGFGIHSENYAIKVGKHPAEQAKISEENFYRQLRNIGNSYDFSRTVETYKPEYYKWTQWLFIQLFNAGLAYKKKAPVNFCPKDLTVLADEQVIDGKCERCGAVVEKRELEQWFFKITNYAQRLLDNIPELNWSEKVKVAQRNWIGKSEGARLKFDLLGIPGQEDGTHKVEVFTTRPDTLFGATFIVISPELAKKWLEVGWKASKEVEKYVGEALLTAENDRTSEEREKTGVDTQIKAINPANKEKIPVWVADFVIGSYGTGAVFADAHDERDFEFAKKFGIPLRPTLKTGDKAKDERIQNLEECFTGDGILIDSGEFSGLSSAEARKKIVSWLEEKGDANPQVNYHLRDWLISRQRYWGPPIPMIHCEKCGWQPVAEVDLPVLLPELEDFKPEGNGKSPLANIESFVNVKCPNCEGPAKRETDVSDTFLDSAWYFLRYACTDIESNAFDTERVKKWLPVKMYIGGAEHSVLHLLYSRFISMVLADLKFIDFDEPFVRFYAHGLIIKDGAKMSKSKGNVIVPDQYIAKFGADTLRMYLMFLGPFHAGGDFRDSGIEGMSRFLKRIWTLVNRQLGSWAIGPNPKNLITQKPNDLQMMNKTIKKVTDDISSLRYNTAIASLMEWYNVLAKQGTVSKRETEVFLQLLAPFAPHMTEELYQNVILNGVRDLDSQAVPENGKPFESIHKSAWPTYDEKFLQEDQLSIVVSVNGKSRDVITVAKEEVGKQEIVEQKAKESANVSKFIDGKNITKVIYVAGKIINFVT